MSSSTKRIARSYAETLQNYADAYFAETGAETATAKEIAAWAIRTKLWVPPPDLALRQCREDFAKAMREQYIEGHDGHHVRAKHVARVRRGDVQLHLWADIRTAGREHMLIAFQQRREQVVGDCRQLKFDVDYYNDEHPTEKPIQMVFDFTDDLAESEFSGEYPPRNPR